jgi:excisionase family DNA binding protein
MDTKSRTAARTEQNVKNLEDIRLYTLTELEPVLGVTHRTLQTYIKDGRLKGVKVGGKWRVTEETLRKFVNGEG